MRFKKISIMGGLVLLTGCANPPLVFSSGTMVGVDIGVNGASTNPVNLVVGFKKLDGTVVPVTATGNNIHEIRGCSNTSAGDGDMGSCSEDQQASSNNRQISLRSLVPVGLMPAQAMSPIPQPDGSFGNQTGSSRDALSVYSSFNGKIDATGGTAPGANVGFGTVFATGVAAQNLTDGARLAVVYQSITPAACLQNLANVLNAGGKATSVTETMIQACAHTVVPQAPQRPAGGQN